MITHEIATLNNGHSLRLREFYDDLKKNYVKAVYAPSCIHGKTIKALPQFSKAGLNLIAVNFTHQSPVDLANYEFRYVFFCRFIFFFCLFFACDFFD